MVRSLYDQWEELAHDARVKAQGPPTGFFQKALAANPHDTLSQTYVDRCAFMKAKPPASDWDCVWIMKDK